MGELTLVTTLQPRGPAAAIVLDDAQAAEIGDGAKTFPVLATINGVTWAGRVTRRREEFLLGLNRLVRADIGVEAGDEVSVVIRLDRDVREVDVPDALAAALAKDPLAQAAWDRLAYSRRKEHARSVAEAKQQATRYRRVVKILATLND